MQQVLHINADRMTLLTHSQNERKQTVALRSGQAPHSKLGNLGWTHPCSVISSFSDPFWFNQSSSIFNIPPQSSPNLTISSVIQHSKVQLLYLQYNPNVQRSYSTITFLLLFIQTFLPNPLPSCDEPSGLSGFPSPNPQSARLLSPPSLIFPQPVMVQLVPLGKKVLPLGRQIGCTRSDQVTSVSSCTRAMSSPSWGSEYSDGITTRRMRWLVSKGFQPFNWCRPA